MSTDRPGSTAPSRPRRWHPRPEKEPSMDEPTLRGLIDQVKCGHLSRRRFLQAMAALGIGAPLAAQMLASAGVAAAESRQPYLVPLRRGGGGDLRILMW